MEPQTPGETERLKGIARALAIVAAIATIVTLFVELQSHQQQEQRIAEQIARQNTQISLQNTQVALSLELNRLAEQQGTITAQQLEAQQQTQSTPVDTDSAFGTATALAESKRNTEETRQALDTQRQSIEATQTALAKMPPAAIPTQPQVSGLVDCGRFNSGETRTVSPSTFVIGDVYVNDTKQHDDGEGEGTIVFFERTGVVYAPFGAGCYQGSIENLDQIVQQQLRDGCGSKCTSVRVVVVRADGYQDVTYRQ